MISPPIDQQRKRAPVRSSTLPPAREIDYDKAFKQLCHLHALSVTGKTTAALDDLVVSAVVLAEGCSNDAHEVDEAIRAFFGLTIPKDDLVCSICRCLEAGTLLRHPSKRLTASSNAKATVAARAESAQRLEQDVRQEWFEGLAATGLVVDDDENLWRCLKHYLALVFRQHGAMSVELLTNGDTAIDAASRDANLGAAVKDCGYDDPDAARIAVAAFLSDVTEARSRYLAQLLDGTFTFFALTVHDATAAYLRDTVEPLTLFLDTNLVFAVLELQDNPLSEIARQLLRLIDENRFPFTLYVHEQTLEEIYRTTSSIGARLRSRRWSQEISGAAVESRIFGQLSGVELRYHQLNAQQPLSVDRFLERFDCIKELLEDKKIRLYREPFGGKDNTWEKGELVAEYQAYLDSERPDLAKPYETIAHDITVWVATQRYRRPAQMAISAGALFLTLDGVLHSFDRKILRRFGVGTVAVPNQLYQLLRPFARPDVELDRKFVETFAIAEFRTAHTGYERTTSELLSILASYSDVSARTGVKILSNRMLKDRLCEVDPEGPEFRELIEAEVFQQNSVLLEELEVERRQKAQASSSIAGLKADIAELAAAKEEVVAERDAALVAVADAAEPPAVLTTSVNDGGVDSESRSQVERLKRHRRLLVAALLAVGLGTLIGLGPWLTHWLWLEQHPRRVALYASCLAAAVALCWAVADPCRREKALWLTVAPLALGAMSLL
jgi:hypothetical protein